MHMRTSPRSEILKPIQVLALPGKQPAPLVFNHGDGTKPIVFDFIKPVRTIKWLGLLAEGKGQGDDHASRELRSDGTIKLFQALPAIDISFTSLR